TIIRRKSDEGSGRNGRTKVGRRIHQLFFFLTTHKKRSYLIFNNQNKYLYCSNYILIKIRYIIYRKKQIKTLQSYYPVNKQNNINVKHIFCADLTFYQIKRPLLLSRSHSMNT